MKRSELKNYIRETILNKLDEASVTVTPGSSAEDVKAAIKGVKDSGEDLDSVDTVAESSKKKG